MPSSQSAGGLTVNEYDGPQLFEVSASAPDCGVLAQRRILCVPVTAVHAGDVTWVL